MYHNQIHNNDKKQNVIIQYSIKYCIMMINLNTIPLLKTNSISLNRSFSIPSNTRRKQFYINHVSDQQKNPYILT